MPPGLRVQDLGGAAANNVAGTAVGWVPLKHGAATATESKPTPEIETAVPGGPEGGVSTILGVTVNVVVSPLGVTVSV